ncbi:MAG: (2Fe-2S)-binding protein [Halanaerobiales bacterium]|nr:(2Fe-2S)-binding protein [Halanaerobiales bacterium]
MKKYRVSFVINGRKEEMEVEANVTLLDLIRDELLLTGAKYGCGGGECGACTVIMDGNPVNSCLVLAPEVNGCEIVTVEGLVQNAELDKIQQSFIDHAALQCGFCTPGMIMSAKALLKKNPHPTEAEVREALAGNLCRCTGYKKIVEAILDVTTRN